MNLKEKYISSSEKKEKPEDKRIEIDDNYYILAELLEEIKGIITIKG